MKVLKRPLSHIAETCQNVDKGDGVPVPMPLRVVTSEDFSEPSSSDGKQRAWTDGELLSALRRGDDSVANEFFRQLLPVVDRTIVRVLGRREQDHDDWIQLCFEQLLKTLATDKYAGQCSLRSWAALIAARVALASLRKRYRDRRLFDKSVLAEHTNAADPVNSEGRAVARVEAERVRRALAVLKPARARILILHDVEGYQLSEIAQLEKSSLAAVQSRLVRGRKQLLAHLRRWEAPK